MLENSESRGWFLAIQMGWRPILLALVLVASSLCDLVSRESVSRRRKLCVNPKTCGADATKEKRPAVLPRAGLELGKLN
jgi:hypothetical protein